MSTVMVDPEGGERPWADELADLIEAGVLSVPDDPEAPDGPRYLDEFDFRDDEFGFQMSRVDALEWELWAGVEQDEAEKTLLELKGPDWVFLPPGGELAAALEPVRPQTESPMALIEMMKAASRMTAWSESIRMSAIASFVRQRQAQAVDIPRPSEVDSRGRPVDPERSWIAEIAAALKLSPDTAAIHVDTALRLTSVLTATHTALRCGAISLSKAIAISDATRTLTDGQAQAVEAHVLKLAPSQSHANLRRSLRKQVAHYDAKNEADRHRDAKTQREVRLVPLPDGMAGLWIVHTAEKIQQMWIVIQAMADLAKRPAPPPNAAAATNAGAERDLAAGGGEVAAEDVGADGSAPADGQNVGQDDVAGGRNAMTDRDADGDGIAGGDGAVAGNSDAVADDGEVIDRMADAAWDAVANGDEVSSYGGSPGADEMDDRPAVNPARESSAQDHPDRGCGHSSTEQRSAGQRRADMAADMFEFVLWNGLDWLGRRLPDQHRRRPHIEVLIPINTLLGLDDDPCELTGYGPIPAGMARRIAADGTWRRLLTDPTNGAVLEASTTRHDPGALVSETLLAAHPVCDWINCNRPARECDRDHGIPFAQTGTTNLADLRSYCEFHHVIKDTPAWGWNATNNPDGSTTLTTPTGHRYTTVPTRPGPITAHPPSPNSTGHNADDEPPPF
jgi:hypothetical protein